ncbi:MAG: hypothetical protein WDO15_11755 [Bacteroidota bacterium]
MKERNGSDYEQLLSTEKGLYFVGYDVNTGKGFLWFSEHGNNDACSIGARIRFDH